VSEDPLSADFTTLEGLAFDMKELSIAFDNSKQPLGNAHDRAVTGAGQFKPKLETGAAQFLLSWEVALRTWSDGSAVVGNNIGKSSIDLRKTDVDFTSAITL
jgi:hypothetical protein